MYHFKSLAASTLLILVVGPVALCSTNDQTNGVDIGTFAKPAAVVRPRFRYWLPDASVDADVLAADIEDAAAVGAGGVEFLPFYEYGGQMNPAPPGSDWSKYNFGTEPFNKLFKTALETHSRLGLAMDIAMGPNQGQGVPASSDDEGLQWDLVPFTEPVPQDGSFDGVSPGWGTGQLVALVSALVLSNRTVNYNASAFGQAATVTYDEYVLDNKSLTDQTSLVSNSSGTVHLSFPAATNGSHYRLFGFYEKLTLHKNLEFNATQDVSIFDNGSYIVDHFSAAGAKPIAKFWEEYILTDDGIRELIAGVGNYLWEDSQEMTSNISWTPSLPRRFKEMHGYDISPYLPLFAFQENNIGLQASSPGPFRCLLNTEDEGLGYINDYRATLLSGYLDYVNAVTTWATETLGIQFSIQPGYNLPVDAMAAVPASNAPECESLGFSNLIDAYRQFVGPANLAGKRVISNELGAELVGAMTYSLPQLLFSANRGFAGGVNQYVIHGQSYTGNWFGTTWPGHSPWRYLFSEMWQNRQPVWDHGLKEALDYMARVQYVEQKGTPKVDVVIYNKESAWLVESSYSATDLLEEGWSYNYLSPDNLALEQAKVEDGVLAPDGPAWKAMIIESTANLTFDTVKKLEAYAEAGLPIVVSGGSPGFYPSGNGSSKLSFDNELAVLLGLTNVYSVGSGEVAGKLSSLGVSPRVKSTTDGTWYTTWRETENVGYALLYADLESSQGTITVASARTPYYLNPWTGESSPVLVYEQNNGTTAISLNLKGNQTAIIAFGDNVGCHVPVPAYHVKAIPSNVVGSEATVDRRISLHIAQSASVGEALLSNGTTVMLDSTSVPAAFELLDWTLSAEHWEAPRNFSDASLPASKRNTTHQLTSLEPWVDIPGLENATGIGYYTATFDWPPAGGSVEDGTLGAYVSFSKILHAIQIEVNGVRVPPLDYTNAVANISPYIRTGQNTLVAIVPTTWWNYFRTILEDITSGGTEPLLLSYVKEAGASLPPAVESGLIGTVTVTPFQSVLC